MVRVFSDKFAIKCNLQQLAAGHASDKTIRKEFDDNIEVNLIGFLSQFNEIYLIQIDTLFVEESLKIEIQNSLQKDNVSTNVICVASHSHSLPSIDSGKPLLGPMSLNFRNSIKLKIIESIKNYRMSKKTAPAYYSNFLKHSKLSIGRRGSFSGGNFSLFNIRSTVPDYKKIGANIEVTVIKDMQTNQLISVIWTFPAHPVLNPDSSKFSSDYPGVVRDLIRKRYNIPNLPILYLPGCSGDMKSFIPAKKKLLDYVIGERFANTNQNSYNAFCESLELELNECINNSTSQKIHNLNSIKYDQLLVPLSEIGIKNKINNNLIVESLYFNNQSRFILMNCEPSNNYSSLLGDDCTISGYSSGVFGYLPTDKQIVQGGYEVSGFMPFFGTSGSFDKNTEKIVTNKINNACSTN
jgi:hypothetical protein